jgi:hypothetical protein
MAHTMLCFAVDSSTRVLQRAAIFESIQPCLAGEVTSRPPQGESRRDVRHSHEGSGAIPDLERSDSARVTTQSRCSGPAFGPVDSF